MKENRELYKEAIADAQAVKSMATANAKAALEEFFAPHLSQLFSAKLQEMETEEETNKEVNENDEVTMEEETNEVETPMDEEINLDELLAELSEEDENLEEAKKDEESEKEESEDEESEKINLEDMSEEDLKSFVEDVIKSMVSTGELEAGHEGEAEEEAEEEEINIDEILAEIELEEKKKKPLFKKVKDFGKGAKDEYVTDKTEADDEAYTKSKAHKISFKEELEEAKKANKKLISEMNEINLLNAKLLYSNKVFKSHNLSESQKVKVLSSFDKAQNVAETKLVYETILSSLKNKKVSKPINESMGSASKAIGKPAASNKPILENEAFTRMQKLAGLSK